MSSSGLKPALKPSSRKLPPPEQYQHSDPLLRRLRLVDDKGKPIDLRRHFRDCKVVALYFSSQWAGAPLKEYQKVRSVRWHRWKQGSAESTWLTTLPISARS
jgi:hypothetical protein